MGSWFSFNGRIGRGTFWFRYIILLVIALASYGVQLIVVQEGQRGGGDALLLLAIALLVPIILSVIAMYATMVKRLHDWGLTGWLSLLLIVPIVGLIWLIVIGAKPGDPGPNKYGPPPLAA